MPASTKPCDVCFTERPATNILSGEERLRLVFKYNFCPFCGRELPSKNITAEGKEN